MRPLILASSSPYRRELLARLRLPFTCASPHINEAGLPGESPRELARRLAEEKARALQRNYPDALIIGSDQVAECDGHTLGKPGSRARAIEQLQLCRGRSVNFHTAVSLLDSASGRQRTQVEIYTVHFRALSERQIEQYLDAEKPFDCAGSFKAEGLGIVYSKNWKGQTQIR